MTDPRATFANAAVAHDSLRGVITAPRYSSGERRRVVTPTAALHARPDSAAQERQVLFGHPVTVLETAGGHAFGRSETMGYVGYLPSRALGPWVEPTHRVGVRATLLFDAPDFKAPDPQPVSLGSYLRVEAIQGRYARLADGRYAIADHLRLHDRPETDPVAVAESLIGTPYLWGGNSAFGIDCSGLVQIALNACGIPCPGDSGQQEQALGETLPPGAPARRGDLIFWKGHVAWVSDPETLLHANAHHMAVSFEPISAAMSRIRDQADGPATRHARLT